MQLTVERFGALKVFYTTEPIPSELDTFPWPLDIAKAVVAADDAWVRLNEAQSEWEDAHDHLQVGAPKLDDTALRAALKADKPDPGTPATDKAKRAEVVQWTAFDMARGECEPLLSAGKAAVSTYLTDHAADLAQYELDRLAEYRAAHVKLTAAQSADGNALGQVGNATRIMSSYTSGRWTDGENVRLQWQADDKQWSNYGLANDQLEAKWEALAATGAEPPPIPIQEQTADQLGTDAAYGNTEAKAELKRRRAASRKAATG